MEQKKRIFSGMQPSGVITRGYARNYGASGPCEAAQAGKRFAGAVSGGWLRP